jgi:hypothetical protein
VLLSTELGILGRHAGLVVVTAAATTAAAK